MEPQKYATHMQKMQSARLSPKDIQRICCGWLDPQQYTNIEKQKKRSGAYNIYKTKQKLRYGWLEPKQYAKNTQKLCYGWLEPQIYFPTICKTYAMPGWSLSICKKITIAGWSLKRRQNNIQNA